MIEKWAVAATVALITSVSPLAAQPDQEIAFISMRDGAPEVYRMHPNGDAQTNLTFNEDFDIDPHWSPDGTTIAFVTHRDGNDEIYSMRANGDAQTNLTFSEADEIALRWSPDGTKIAFLRMGDDGNGQIWVMNANGDSQAPLSDGEGNDARPEWSPDGEWIAFERSVDGAPPEIWKMRKNGGAGTQLTYDKKGAIEARWSPDGAWIAYVTGRTDDPEIWKMRQNGDAQTQLTYAPGLDKNPRWSPNGEFIAFESERDGNKEIYRMRSSGDGQTNLTLDEGSDGNHRWSRNSDYIVFTSSRNDAPGIYLMRSNGDAVTPLSVNNGDGGPVFGPMADSVPAVVEQPDPRGGPPVGSYIAFTRDIGEGQGWGLFTCNPDGSNVRRVGDILGVRAGPCISPDRRWLAYSRDVGDNLAELFVCDLEGNERQITNSPGVYGVTSWTPDGLRLLVITKVASDADLRLVTHYWIPVDGGAWQPVPAQRYQDWLNNEMSALYARLSFDGQRIAHTRSNSKGASGQVKGGNSDVWIVDADGGNPRPLASLASFETAYSPTISPDGTMVAFSYDRGVGIWPDGAPVPTRTPDGRIPGKGLALVPVGGGPVRILSQDYEIPPFIVWSPDGSELLIRTALKDDPNDKWGLHIVDVDSGHRRRLPIEPQGVPIQGFDWR